MKTTHEIWDGDTYPVMQFQFSDSNGQTRDLTDVVMWFDVYDEDNTFIVKRPGKIVSPKSGGIVECFFAGSETDWGGVGAKLIVKPYIMVPSGEGGITALNVLTNASFDSSGGAPPTQIGTSWQIIGTQTTSEYTINNVGPKPPSIFNMYQQIKRPTVSGTDILRQFVSGQSGQPGDTVTFGIWVRGENISGTQNNNNSIRLAFTLSQDNATVQLPVGSFDWRFITVSRVLTLPQTTYSPQIFTSGNTGTWRFDEACVFEGRYRVFPADPRRVIIRRRPRSLRTTNQIIGVGGFERDSDGDGLPDGWMMDSDEFTPTLTMEQNATFVSNGRASLKAVCNGGNGVLRTAIRGKFNAGETWRASIAAKTSGTLTGTAPSIVARTGQFLNGEELSTPTSIGQTLPTFTTYTTDLVLTKPCETIELNISLNGCSGTLWFDDAQLFRL